MGKESERLAKIVADMRCKHSSNRQCDPCLEQAIEAALDAHALKVTQSLVNALKQILADEIGDPYTIAKDALKKIVEEL